MLSAPPLFAYSGNEVGVGQALRRLVVQQFVNRKPGDARQQFQIFNRRCDLAAQPVRHRGLTDSAESREVGLQHVLRLQVFLESRERFSQRLRRSSHPANIGDSDTFAIGQTYIGFPQTAEVPKKPEIRTFWERAREALDDAARAGKTHGGLRIKPTQTFAAKIADVKQPSVSDWNKPGKGPELENALKLATALGVCVEWLYTERGPKRPGVPLDNYAQQLWELWPHLPEGEKGYLLGHAANNVAVPNGPFNHELTPQERPPKRGT